MVKHSLITVSVLVFAFSGNNYAQGCCGLGGSLVSGGHPVLDKGTVLFNSGGNYSDAENPSRRRGGLSMQLAFGITDRLSLSLKTSYIWAWSLTHRMPIIVDGNLLEPGKDIHFNNNDFGDGYAGVQFAVIRLTPMNKQELIAGMDLGIPWSPDRKMIDGVVLPGNVQTGQGGFSLNGFLTYLKAFPDIHLSFSSTFMGRVIFKTRKGKDPGDEFSAMITTLFGPFFNTRESISLNFNTIGMTYNELDMPETGTPGKRLSLTPALEYSILPDLKVSINAEIPIWRDKNQSLYGNNRVFRLETFWFIRSKGKNPDGVKLLHL